MNRAILSNIAEIVMGQSPPSSTYNVAGKGLPFFQGKADFGEMYPTPRVYCSEPNRIAEPGDILITVRAPVGPTNINVVQSCIGRGLAAIRASKSVDRDYLLYFLRFYEPELAKAGTGSTFAAISCEDLETVKIPLPPLPEQRRIADLLSRADRLRRLRRYADSLANSLLQSVFLEMFGDVRSNSKNLDIVSIGDCVKPTKQINPLSLGRSEFWYVDITTIDRETKTISQPNLIKADDAPSRARKSILSNDILVSTVRPNLNAVAKVPASLDGQIASTGFCVLRVNENKILSEYLFAFVQSNYFVDYLVENQTGANYPAVSDGIILDTPIPVPPLPQQEQFAAVVRRVESLRARAGESERQVEGLFQSLLAEAFTYL